MRRTHYLFTAVVLVELIMIAGCSSFRQFLGWPTSPPQGTTPSDPKVRRWAERAGNRMDEVARGLEEFGTISVSSPLLAPAAKFDFAVDAGPNDYFKDAKAQVQGRVAVSEQFAQQTGVGLRAQGDIGGLLGALDAAAAYREELGDYETKRRLTRHAARLRAQQEIDALPPDATPAQRAAAEERAARILLEESPGSATTRPSYPTTAPTTAPSIDSDLVPAPDKALGVLSGAQFTSLRGLLANADTTLQNRAALNIAAGDTATEAIFSLLGNPTGYIGFKDKRILFGAGMVGVSPGWRTKSGFAADVSVLAEFVYVPARREYRDAWLDYVNDQLAGLKKKGAGDPELAELKRLLEEARKPVVPPDKEEEISYEISDAPPPTTRASESATGLTGGAPKGPEEGGGTKKPATPPADDQLIERPTTTRPSGNDATPRSSADSPAPGDVVRTLGVLQTASGGRSSVGGQGSSGGASVGAGQSVGGSSGRGGSSAGSNPSVGGGRDVGAATRGGDRSITVPTTPGGSPPTGTPPAATPVPAKPPKGRRFFPQGGAGPGAGPVFPRIPIGTVSSYSGPGDKGGHDAAAGGGDAGAVQTAADVDVRFRVPSTPPSPLVAAVSPMTDAEVLDLSSNVRQQRAFALAASLALQYAGLKGQAAVFDQWVKRLEKDVVTRGASAAVSTYSHSGGMFGFQIGPRLRAVGAGGIANRAAMVLERQSFPVLIILGMDEADLEPKFAEVHGQLTAFEPVLVFRQSTRWLPVDQPRPVERLRNDATRSTDPRRYQAMLDYNGVQRGISEAERIRWAVGLDAALRHAPRTPTERQALLGQIKEAASALQSLKPPGDTLSYAQARGLAMAEDLLSTPTGSVAVEPWALRELAAFNRAVADGKKPRLGTTTASKLLPPLDAMLKEALESTTAGPALEATRGRIGMLTYHAIGSSTWQYLPIEAVLRAAAPAKPEAELSLTPVSDTLFGLRDGTSHFVITGKNLKGHITGATLEPLGADPITGLLVLNGAVVVSVKPDPKKDPGPTGADLYLSTDKEQTVKVAKVVFNKPPPPANADPGIRVERDAAGRPTRILANGQEIKLSPEELVEVLRVLIGGDGRFRFGADATGGFRMEVDGAAAPAPKSPIPAQQQQQGGRTQ
jgi:hypothetical protein